MIMTMPNSCPICGDILLNEYHDFRNGNTKLIKSCKRRINHNITFDSTVKNHDLVDFIRVPYSNEIIIIWYLWSEHLLLNNTTNGEDYDLPFFKPDFTNYEKMITKIKTYITFS